MAKFIIDNGAYLAKSGFSTDDSPKLTPNYIARTKNGRETFVGSDLDECKDFSGLFYNLAFQRGILINWDIERQVWNQIFKKQNVDCGSTQLIVTEPVFNFAYSQECLEELVFEEFGFDGFIRITAPNLACFKNLRDPSTTETSAGGASRDFCLVVDSGYSFTHIVPFYKGNMILEGIRRLNLGGKHLTNHLKEIISYRQLMVMDETYVINQVKEDVCFVSNDFYNDMKIAKFRGRDNTIVRDYVLPDYANIRKGYAKSQEESTGKAAENEQIIRLNNERFTVPELLFHPSDIGIKEMGISEAIVDSVESCSKEVRNALYSNIQLAGGNARFKGFRDRIYHDVRCLIADDYELNVRGGGGGGGGKDDEVAWQGGKLLANSGAEFNDLVVSKKAYDEFGHALCHKKFDIQH